MSFGDCTWTEIRDMLAAGPVVVMAPCGAVEAHGPHLPLNTDVIISEGVARRAAAMLTARGISTLILPALSYAPAAYAEAFAGTIGIGAETARAQLVDIGRSLHGQGIACLGLANSHFDPANVAMLRAAAADISQLGLRVAFPDFTRRALAQQLTPEFQSGACHAGQFETSLVLADRPDLVRAQAQLALAENPASLTEAFSRGAKTFEEAGGPLAYFGAPAAASAAEGERSYAIMAQALADAVRDALGAA